MERQLESNLRYFLVLLKVERWIATTSVLFSLNELSKRGKKWHHGKRGSPRSSLKHFLRLPTNHANAFLNHAIFIINLPSGACTYMYNGVLHIRTLYNTSRIE